MQLKYTLPPHSFHEIRHDLLEGDHPIFAMECTMLYRNFSFDYLISPLPPLTLCLSRSADNLQRAWPHQRAKPADVQRGM